MTIDRVSGSALVLLGLFVVWERRVLPLGTHHQPGPGYFPLLLSLLLILLGALLVCQGGTAQALSALAWPEAPHALAILACCAFTTLCLEQIGYRISMLIILGFLLGVLERLRLWLVAVLTLGLSLGTFWLFDSLLRVPLPRGAWGF
jgi:putative tricarboxylic transport membrane protein